MNASPRHDNLRSVVQHTLGRWQQTSSSSAWRRRVQQWHGSTKSRQDELRPGAHGRPTGACGSGTDRVLPCCTGLIGGSFTWGPNLLTQCWMIPAPSDCRQSSACSRSLPPPFVSPSSSSCSTPAPTRRLTTDKFSTGRIRKTCWS